VTPQRFKALLAEYGQVALFTYFGIFILVLAGFAVAIAAGIKPDSVTSNVGVLGGAYIAAKVTQPLRIAATLALTPIVARVLRRSRGATPEERKEAEAKEPLPPDPEAKPSPRPE
jgi:hypothetical protein